jgi:uncharacterized protein YjbI with pentapeptide repeats
LRGADLREADLFGADFRDADLREANLEMTAFGGQRFNDYINVAQTAEDNAIIASSSAKPRQHT